MSQDLVGDILNSVVDEYVEKRANQLLKEGVPIENISEKIESEINQAEGHSFAEPLIEQFSDDCVASIEKIMESELDSQYTEEKHFLDDNNKLWKKGFDMSMTMYGMVTEAAQKCRNYYCSLPGRDKDDLKYRFNVLYELTGRACQEFLEILWLLKGGFADAAYSRCRSIYEISVVSELISTNDESVAKAYYEAAFTDDTEYNWARALPRYKDSKQQFIRFGELRKMCTVVTSGKWNNMYKKSCKTLHAAPQGTFARIGLPDSSNIISVGRSEYGIAVPAVNSAISLMFTMCFLASIIHNFDSKMHVRTIQKWLSKLSDYYSDIEKTLLDQ